jgi:preprotein translocase subunit YajC
MTDQTIKPGDRVRVSGPDASGVGTVSAVADDTAMVVLDSGVQISTQIGDLAKLGEADV